MRKSIALIAGLLMITILMTGCGDDATGPQQGEGGESTYTVDDFTFAWQQDPDSDQHLLISISAPTTGWVAVGFEPASFMEDADLIIGYVDQGTASVRDDFGTGQFTHVSDVSLGGTSDVSSVSGEESSGNTTVSFRIPYDSEDQYDAVLQEGSSYTFIFAYGADGADDYTSTHVWAQSTNFEL